MDTNDMNLKEKIVRENCQSIAKIQEVLMTDKYTVWVGGTEVNDSLLEYDDAIKLADSYRKKEYDDVIVECIEYNEGVK